MTLYLILFENVDCVQSTIRRHVSRSCLSQEARTFCDGGKVESRFPCVSSVLGGTLRVWRILTNFAPVACSFVVAHRAPALHESRSEQCTPLELCSTKLGPLLRAWGSSVTSLCSIILSEYTRTLGTRGHCWDLP